MVVVPMLVMTLIDQCDGKSSGPQDCEPDD